MLRGRNLAISLLFVCVLATSLHWTTTSSAPADDSTAIQLALDYTGSPAKRKFDDPGETADVKTAGPSRKKIKLDPEHSAPDYVSVLLENIDETKDPCDNFYDYVCGPYISKVNIPVKDEDISPMLEIQAKVTEQLWAVISKPYSPEDPKAVKIVHDLYTACMNEDMVHERKFDPVKEIVERLGGWPVLGDSDWTENSFSWTEMVHKFGKEGIHTGYLINLSAEVDKTYPEFRVLKLLLPRWGLNKDYLLEGTKNINFRAYNDYQVDLAVMFGANRAQAEKDMSEAVKFEAKLAEISACTEECEAMKITDLQESFPFIPWLDYIKGILPSSIRVDENERIVVDVPRYLTRLKRVLIDTPKKVIANYMVSQAIMSIVPFLHEEAREMEFNFKTVRDGPQEYESRRKECVRITCKNLPLAVGSLYVREFFSKEAQTEVIEMGESIRNELIEILRTIDWMDDVTRRTSIKRIETMAVHIAPDELWDYDKLNEYHDEVIVTPNHYLEAILRINKVEIMHSFNRLRQTVDKTDWTIYGKEAIATRISYGFNANNIYFPAAVLQGKMFSKDWPKCVSYGTLASLSHEMMHAFDREDEDSDEDDERIEIARRRFSEVQRCLVEQYEKDTVREVNKQLNGEATLAENFADVGGAELAYRTYLTWMQTHAPEELGVLTDFSPKQIFWIAFGSTYCSKYTPEFLLNIISTGKHSPGEFRVNGPLRNHDGFKNDFNCKGKKTNMNPDPTCHVLYS